MLELLFVILKNQNLVAEGESRGEDGGGRGPGHGVPGGAVAKHRTPRVRFHGLHGHDAVPLRAVDYWRQVHSLESQTSCDGLRVVHF